jgi:hypothetical protein
MTMQLAAHIPSYVKIYSPTARNEIAELEDAKEITLHPDLLGILIKLNAKKPTWRFETRVNFGAKKPLGDSLVPEYTVTYRSVMVWENSERLGNIIVSEGYSARIGKHCTHYYVESNRILKKRGDSHTMLTTKQASALDTCIKYMYSPTVLEMGQKAVEEARKVVNNAVSTAQSKILIAIGRNDLRLALLSFAETHADTFNNVFPAHSAIFAEALDSKQDLAICTEVARTPLAYALVTNQQVHVFDVDGKLVALDDNAGNGLPEWFRRKMGLLKLVERTQFVRDVGVRVADKYYAIAMDVTNNETFGETK